MLPGVDVLHRSFGAFLLSGSLIGVWVHSAAAQETRYAVGIRTITGAVQNQDRSLIDKARVFLRDQVGEIVAETVSDQSGGFSMTAPASGTYSVNAALGILRSQYVILKIGAVPPRPVLLTLDLPTEIALDVVAPLPPLKYRSSSETFSLNRKEIEALPRGNNIDLDQLLLTIPSAAADALKQVHIRQDHANLQFRIDDVPIPDTVTSTFTDVLTPRAWERSDIILGGPEARYGDRTAAVFTITPKGGTSPAFGSVQTFGGGFQTVNPSFEYGGMIGDKFRYYVLNSATQSFRGIDPPTVGRSIFHDQSLRNQTFLRGQYQPDILNSFSWTMLASVAKFQIPTSPGGVQNPMVVRLLQPTNHGFSPVPSQSVNEFQLENNQYGQMVWHHDIDARRYFYLAGYFRQTRATFVSDPLNVLSYSQDASSASAASQDRQSSSGGLLLERTDTVSPAHLLKAGFQVQGTQAVNKTRIYAFARDAMGNPTGPLLTLPVDNRTIGWRESAWVQDQWTPADRWTLNLGLRFDHIQALTTEGQFSPRVGLVYKANQANVFHAFYGRLFTPPFLESLAFLPQKTLGTTVQPENLANNRVRPERAHYFEVGSTHAITRKLTVQVTGYYKLNHNQSDDAQFGSTPLLDAIAFRRGYQRGIDVSFKAAFTKDLIGMGTVAWGQCKNFGLQSGQFLFNQEAINDINSKQGVFCDHSQFVTSSSALSYRLPEGTSITVQMLYGYGLRSTPPGGKVNSTHEPPYTVFNLSGTHVFPLGGPTKLLLGVDVLNLFDEQYFFNMSGQSIGLGVTHVGMPRSVFFRAQVLF